MTLSDSSPFSIEDHRWMRRALTVAERALNLSSPNPRVGCVLVRDGRWISEGHTQMAGGRHAEAQALHEAIIKNLDVRGATAYVTLEPCSHSGRTAPCASALINAGIARVVIALQDPNPLVAGQGINMLRAAGIPVDVGLFAEESLAINPGFCARMTRATPWVRLKSASSFDGRTAMPDGCSQWITREQARADGHRWRARACMVLTGIGTVMADNPVLDVRALDTPRQPWRGVLDSKFAISEHARMINGDPLWVFTCHMDGAKAARLAPRNVRVVVLPANSYGSVDLDALMRCLAELQINELHVEGGAKLLGAMVAANFVDEWLGYFAPSIMGAGRALADLPAPIESLEQAHNFEFMDGVQIGPDMRLRMRNAKHWQALCHACGV